MEINRKKYKDINEFVRTGKGCATAEPTRVQITRVDEELRTNRRSLRIKSVDINIIFHHLTYGAFGQITKQQREEQIEVLNKAYNPHGIHFKHEEGEVRFIDDYEWYYMGHRSKAERTAKNVLQVDPTKNLNFYTAGLQASLLGWATFPFDFAGDSIMDGVVVLDATLPGGDGIPYNLGKTAIHEIGHWCGLYHTFQGGCDPYGDHVNDTVAHSSPNYGCPTETDNNACDPNQIAPFKNYMNYTEDACMDEFTNEQSQRMLDQIVMYRSGFINTNS